MNAYERVESLIIVADRKVLTENGVGLPGTFVVRHGDAEAALRKRLLKLGVSCTLVSMAHVLGLRVYIGRALFGGQLVQVSIEEMDRALKARPPGAPALARLAALTVAKHAHKLTEA